MAQSKQSVWATLPPITCGAFATATIMYPVDLVRALTMSAAGDGAKQSTVQLIQAFHKQHGLKGFATQGVAPEMLRATYMRVLKFFLFPICHKSMFGKPESQGNALTKGLAAGLASLPEGFTIQPIETSIRISRARSLRTFLRTAAGQAFSSATLACSTDRHLGPQFTLRASPSSKTKAS